MPLSSQEAAEVAARRGLSLSDAAALRQLADSTEEADSLAQQFAADDDVDPAEVAKRIGGI